jgi:hypothetical protein
VQHKVVLQVQKEEWRPLVPMLFGEVYLFYLLNLSIRQSLLLRGILMVS